MPPVLVNIVKQFTGVIDGITFDFAKARIRPKSFSWRRSAAASRGSSAWATGWRPRRWKTPPW